LKLAREIDKVALAKGHQQAILIQVRIGEEETKRGIAPAEVREFVKACLEMPGLRVRGLMSLPPLSTDEEVSRGYFRELRELADRLRQEVLGASASAFDILSMGTTGDFERAIREGATHVRIGTAIFGERGR
jgi:pyridoxal phosphate enzyme (YggS family)